MPQCLHVFYEPCGQQWLDFKFSCPNCNLPIDFDGDRDQNEEQEAQNQAVPGAVPAMEHEQVAGQFFDHVNIQIASSSSSDGSFESMARAARRLRVHPEDSVSDEEQKEGLRIMLGDRFIYYDSEEEREQPVSLASGETTDDELQESNGYLETYLGSHHDRPRRSASESSLSDNPYL